jgi:glycosyltransferase involved in cell wall biosynthesis
MKLSIITINYNNAEGLRKTLASVASQTFCDFEHIIVDGGSTDGSVEIIREYADSEAIRLEGYEAIRQENSKADKQALSPHHLITSSPITWISEKDRGVYDAQNKGIRLAHGEYCYFLNAGDTFCADDVLERMFSPNSLIASSPNRLPDILYGNEVIVDGAGQRVSVARGVKNPTFVDLYNSCMKHQASFIRRSLFDKYGMYDADMRICSDFDWFFRVIAFHDEVTLQYKDVDIAYFENTGLSYHSPELCAKERQQILDSHMTKRMQRDYLLLGKYPRLSRVGENKIVKLLLRIANRLLK